ncbi:hypothetical protein BS47DRAFT_333960 [Hydnum rufescens UP504]|uniref:Uncharacterized protein n=1 Tax=Hydnum rufescens UP504 TaxID=1448309 RepID=A0A9P6B687_9AGAM|nr:hypothetical protein BS47DRAFT_333960 [Hydnum rufescens UP504]
MIGELKAPALLSLDLFLPKCSERYAREIIPMLMTFFRSSPLIQDLAIRMNCSVVIKILNALRSPHEEALISPGSLILPRLRHLEFHRLFDQSNDRDQALIDEFLGRWQRKDGSKVLECLKLESYFYHENDCYKDYVQDFDYLTDENEVPTPYRFHELDERRSDADEAEITWTELVISLEGDDAFDG